MVEAVPLNPMQMMKAAAQMRARECLEMLQLAVIMHFQEQSLPQPCQSQYVAGVCDGVWYGIVSSALLAVVLCFHCLLDF